MLELFVISVLLRESITISGKNKSNFGASQTKHVALYKGSMYSCDFFLEGKKNSQKSKPNSDKN